MNLTTYTQLERALQEVDDAAVDRWLQAFLRSEGDNAKLADGLRLQPRFYLGPVLYPLSELRRTCGPEPEMTYRTTEERWERKLAGMSADLRAGWLAPPLIVYGHDSAVHDGNHRAGAMIRAGRGEHSVIFFFDDAAARAEFVAARAQGSSTDPENGHAVGDPA